MVNAAHVRAARGLLDWSRDELAERAGVVKRTVLRIEHGAMAHESTWAKIQTAFESAGVEFVFENGRCIGVLLR